MSVSTDTQSEDAIKLTLKGGGVSFERTLDEETARRVIDVAMGGGGGTTKSGGSSPRRSSGRSQRKDASKGTKPKRRSKSSPGMVRDLSLKPKGKTSFSDFAEEKKPKTHAEKQIVAVAWLRDTAGLSSGIGVDHVNTCYREKSWSRPADLENSLSSTAAQKGWLDTADMKDIKLTSLGEDEVEHDLPRSTK